jgi:hypothetical protein
MSNESPARRSQSGLTQHDDTEVPQLRRELMALEAQLGQRELELATTRAELSAFSDRQPVPRRRGNDTFDCIAH